MAAMIMELFRGKRFKIIGKVNLPSYKGFLPTNKMFMNVAINCNIVGVEMAQMVKAQV